MQEQTKKNISDFFLQTFGITYEEFEQLDYDKQKELINNYHSKMPKRENDEVRIMIGSGESSLFSTVKKGEKVMISSGDESIFVIAGETAEEQKRKIDEYFDKKLSKKKNIRFKRNK